MALIRQGILKQDLNLGYGTDTITADSGGSLVGDKIGMHTFMGSKFIALHNVSGTDFGDQLNTAIAAVGDNAVIDARGITASASFSTAVTVDKAVHIILPDYTMTYTGSGRAFDITSNGVSIVGNGMDSALKMGSAANLIRLNNVTKCHLRDFTLDGGSRAYAVSGLVVGSSSGISNLIQIQRVRFVDIQGSALALTSTAEFDDWEMLYCIIDNCGTASAAAIALDGTSDTARLIGNQYEGFIGTGLSGSANILRLRMFGDKFHGDTPSNTNIAIDWNGYRSEFIGNQFNFIQGTDQVLIKNVDNCFINNEFTDPDTTTNCFNLSSSASRNRIIANEISGPTSSTGIAIKLNAVGDNIVTNNIIRNAGTSASFFAIKEVSAADRNLVTNNVCINAGTAETITGVNSLFSDNGALDDQTMVRRTQIFATGDAVAPTLAGDVRIKRTGSHLGSIEFDDANTKIVGTAASGSPASSIEMYVANALVASQNSTELKLATGLSIGGAATAVNGAIGFPEISDPSAPAANKALLYVRDTGGKTELVCRFPTGAIQQVAIEP